MNAPTCEVVIKCFVTAPTDPAFTERFREYTPGARAAWKRAQIRNLHEALRAPLEDSSFRLVEEFCQVSLFVNGELL
jgi:hypothetical protein